MKPATRDHVLAATHFVLGPTNFIVLRLPTNWDVRIGRNPSDVDYTVLVDGVRWAQEGRAHAFIIDENARRALEFDLKAARTAIKSPALEDAEDGPCTVFGHPATFVLGGTRLGLFHNKPFAVLRVAYRCEDTGRNLSLTFMARGDRAELKALLPSMAGSRCH